MAKNFSIQVSASLDKKSAQTIQKQLNTIGKKSSKNFEKTSTNVKKVNDGLKDMNQNLEKSGQGFAEITGKIALWTAATGVIFGMQRAIKDLTHQVIELDGAMLELAKVTNLSASEMSSLTDEMFELGEQTGRTGIEVVNAFAEFARAGFEIERQVPILAEYSLVMTNVADGIETTAEAAGVLISIIKGFGLEAEEASRITDVLNEVSNNTAISFDALADIMSRSSAVVAQTGTSLEELAAIGTAAFEVLRDSSKVGSALNTVSLRLRGLDESGEGVVGLMSELQQSFKDLAGVDIVDANGQLLSTFEIVELLSDKWEELDGNTQSYLAELAGGKRQASVFLSIMNNYSTVQDALNSALNSTNSSLIENEKFLNSVQGRMNQFATAWQELAKNTIDSDILKWFIDFGISLVKLIDGIGLGNIALTGLILVLPKLIMLLDKVKLATVSANLAMGGWVLVILGVIKVLDSLIVTNEEFASSMQENFDAIDKNIDRLEILIGKYKDLKDSDSLTALQRIELAEIEQELADRYGVTVDMLEGQVDMTRLLIEAKKAEIEAALATADANWEEVESRKANLEAIIAMEEAILGRVSERGDFLAKFEIDIQKKKIKGYQEELDAINDVIINHGKQKAALEEINKIIEELNSGISNQNDELDEQNSIIDEGNDALTRRSELIDKLEKQIDDLNDTYDDEKLASELRIEALEDQIDILRDQQELIERTREDEELTNKILEARQRLLNAQTQKNVWTFMGDDLGWQLTADPRAVKEAADALDEQLKIQKELQEDRIIEDQIRALQDKIDNERDLITQLKRSIDAQVRALKDQIDIIVNAEANASASVVGNTTSTRTSTSDTRSKIGRGRPTGGPGDDLTDFDLRPPSTPTPTPPTTSMGGGRAQPTFEAFDVGTDSAPGGLSLVHQDELVNLPSGSGVLTKDETKNMRAFGRNPIGMISKLLPLIGGANNGNGGNEYNFYDTIVKADSIDKFLGSIQQRVPSAKFK